MRTLRLLVAATATLVALSLGSGVAFAGAEWCDWGSPPPMDTPTSGGYMVSLPAPHTEGMMSPMFTNPNGKFTENQVSGNYLPPGMTQASAKK